MCDRSLFKQDYFENIKGSKLRLKPPFMIVISTNFTPAEIMKRWIEQALQISSWNEMRASDKTTA